MKKFSYRAIKANGSKIEEQYEANSREEVVSMITSLGYYPLKIEEVKSSGLGEISFERKVTVKDLSLFCRQMHTMLDAGISITNSLEMLSTQVTNKKLQGILVEIQNDVKKGEMLSSSMRKYPDEFPKLLISMVESGEASGNLDEMMLRMAKQYEKESKINSKIKSAMIYPIMICIVAIVALAVIMVVVMPTFKEIFESEDISLPLITRALIGLSEFMVDWWYILLLILIVIVVALNKFRKTKKGYIFFSKLKLKIPIISKLTKKIVVSRFTRTLATLITSGVPIVEALPIVQGVLRNSIAEEEMDIIKEKVVKGEGLSVPIKESLVFPDLLASMVNIGEEAGSLDDMLNKTADFYDEEVDVAITNATAMIEPILIIIMGISIGAIVIAIMLPLFNMYSAL